MEALVRLVLAAIGWGLARLSPPCRARSGALVGTFVAGVLRIRRREVASAIDRAGLDAIHARSSYEHLGASLFEMLAVHGGVDPREHVAFDRDGRELLEGAPCVIAATHTANWELVLAEAARIATDHGGVAAVVKPLSIRAFDAFCRRFRGRFGTRLLAPARALETGASALREGRKVVMLVDQVPPGRRSLRRTFLGRTALIDRAPFVLAARAGVPVAVVAAHRDGTVSRVHVLAVLSPHRMKEGRNGESSETASEWIDGAAARASDIVDGFVRAHPADWLWLHRRWKGAEEGASSANVALAASPR